MIERCRDCGANIAMVGLRHRCVPRLSLSVPTIKAAMDIEWIDPKDPDGDLPMVQSTRKDVGVLRRGRPKIEGKRPWEVEGVSRRTWYRRRG